MLKIDRTLSVAPMMNWTDRHCRFFHRILSKQALLYTEMINANAIVKGDRKQLLRFDPKEHPVALQIGGSDPKILGEATKIGADFGYDEINLNVGCPSDRVQSGFFGAILMKKPDLVAHCISEMKKQSGKCHISIKCRLGVDDQNPSLDLPIFLQKVIESGVDSIIIHARKALLGELSPKQNRDIPRLDYNLVKSMTKKFPDVDICLNGGITNLSTAAELINDGMAGVMIGRAAYNDPRNILLPADEKIFKQKKQQISMPEALEIFCSYIDDQMVEGTSFRNITKHLLGAFNGLPGARSFRRIITEGSNNHLANSKLLTEATNVIEELKKISVGHPRGSRNVGLI